RDAVGHDPGHVVPAVQAARVPHVAAAPSFRTQGLGRVARRAAVLHRGRAAGSALTFHPEAAMTIDASHPLPGRHPLVMGAARSGLAAAALLRNHGLDVLVADAAPAAERAEAARRVAELGAAAAFGRDDAGLLEGRDLVIWSPGITDRHALASAARAQGHPVLSELELGYLAAHAPMVCVTG